MNFLFERDKCKCSIVFFIKESSLFSPVRVRFDYRKIRWSTSSKLIWSFANICFGSTNWASWSHVAIIFGICSLYFPWSPFWRVFCYSLYMSYILLHYLLFFKSSSFIWWCSCRPLNAKCCVIIHHSVFMIAIGVFKHSWPQSYKIFFFSYVKLSDLLGFLSIPLSHSMLALL